MQIASEKIFKKFTRKAAQQYAARQTADFFWGEKIGFNKIMRFGCAFYPAKILGFFVLRYETCVGFFTVVNASAGKMRYFLQCFISKIE